MDLLQHLLHLADQSKAALQGAGGHHARNEPPKGSRMFWWTPCISFCCAVECSERDGSSISLTPLTAPNLFTGQPPSSLAAPGRSQPGTSSSLLWWKPRDCFSELHRPGKRELLYLSSPVLLWPRHTGINLAQGTLLQESRVQPRNQYCFTDMIYLCDPSRSLEFIHSVAFAGSLLTIEPSVHLVIFYIYIGLCAFQVQYKLIHLIFLSHDSCLQCWVGLIPASQAFQQWNCYLTNYPSKSQWGTGGWAPLSVLTSSSCHSSKRALSLSAAEEREKENLGGDFHLVCFHQEGVH